MKKILILIFSIFLFTLNLVSLKIFNVNKVGNILYTNNLELSVDNSEKTINYDEFLKVVTNLSYKLNINISQYVNSSENSLYIFSTNPKSDKKISLIKGNFSNVNSEQYTSNKFESKNIGTLKIPSDVLYIRIYDFDQIKNWGLGKDFIISNINKKDYSKLISSFEQFGKVKIKNQTPNIFYGSLFSNPSLIIILIISGLLLLCSITYYLINSKKRLSIQEIFGFNNFLNIYKLISPIILISTFVDIFILGGISIYIYLQKGNMFILEFIIVSIIILIIVLTLTFLYSIFISNILIKTIKLKDVLRGKGEKTGLNQLIYLTKLIICIAVIFVSVLLNSQYTILNNKLNSLQYWNKTKNINRIAISSLANLDDLKAGRIQNDKLKKLYKKLEKNKQAFIIDASNYTLLDNNTYAYSNNIKSGNFEYGSNGKSITIDRNYLKQNQIKTYSSEKNINYLINTNPNVLNILVPYKYKNLEKQIYDSYLDSFYFNKIEVDNLYNKELQLPLNKTTKSDLKINIIYVNNNQKYFTYSQDLGNSKNNNCIIDPIAIIYTDNMDSSFICAWMTHNLYFVDKSNGQAYSNILKYLKETNTQNIVQKFVISIYSEVNSEIIKLQNKINDLIFIIFIFFIVILFFSLTCTSLFYKNNSYKIYLKTLLGYSIIDINSRIIYLMVLLNTIAILINVFINIKSITLILLIGSIIILFDIFLVSIFSFYLNKQNINKIIKGEK
ncbi:hypothetical protein ACXATC_003958 [Clostridium sporogenes]